MFQFVPNSELWSKPITNFTRAIEFSASCGATIPPWMAELFSGLDADPDTRHLVAATVAVEQCRQLHAEGVKNFHFYTLNRAELTVGICHMLGIRPKQPAAEAATN